MWKKKFLSLLILSWKCVCGRLLVVIFWKDQHMRNVMETGVFLPGEPDYDNIQCDKAIKQRDESKARNSSTNFFFCSFHNKTLLYVWVYINVVDVCSMFGEQILYCERIFIYIFTPAYIFTHTTSFFNDI